MVNYDLHVHTQESDGIYTPQEIINIALEIGLSGIAITDHDTIAGLTKAENYIKENNIDLSFIPGIELNTEIEDKEVHILGYYIDFETQELQKRLRKLRIKRQERAQLIVEKLQKLGLIIKMSQVEKMAKGGLIGRPHIGMALVESGYINTIEESFVKYIGRGKPAYVPRYKFTTQEAITMVKSAGGIAVLAHPGLIGNIDIVKQVLNMEIEGIEVYYPQHRDEETTYFLNLCHERGLLVTGGSDFHGTGKIKGIKNLGKYGINETEFLEIKRFWQKK
jgi:predicted metal-dependent phosphoesterase TrpH